MGSISRVIACNVADAVAAEQGGADRIELISNYEVGAAPRSELVRAGRRGSQKSRCGSCCVTRKVSISRRG
jgi:hypothetical protein